VAADAGPDATLPPWPALPAAPRYGSASLAELLPSVLVAIGVSSGPAPLEIAATRRVVVLVVDGLGWHNLRAGREHAPFLAGLQDTARVLDSGFPSTTPIALTSFGTGLPPGIHGIAGLFLRLPGSTTLLDTLRPPTGINLRALQPRPTAFERAAAAGVEVSRVGPRAFDGAGLTEIGLRGGRYVGANGFGERVAATVSSVEAGERTLVYVYVGDLDVTGHHHGWRSEAWRQELAHIDRFVAQLAGALPDGTLLLVTADHGMVDIGPDDRVDIARTPALADGVDLLGGDLRGLHVYPRPGAADDVLTAWRDTLGPRAWVLPRDEAVAAGWFGEVRPEVLPVLGDVVVATREDVSVCDSRTMPAQIRDLIGMHGSLSAWEQHVPLLSLLVG
jgi:hypothetical protein